MSKNKDSVNLIKRDTIISDILEGNPSKARELAETLFDFGIHCVGCGASSFETIGEGVLGHGFSEEELDGLLVKLNNIVSEAGDSVDKISEEDFKINFSESAVSKIKDMIKDNDKNEPFLKISVVPGGCSGYRYEMKFLEKPEENSLNIKINDLDISVDKESIDLLNNVEINYVENLNESGFKFKNPNAQIGCSCGKSFG